jgi:hypothetical protein
LLHKEPENSHGLLAYRDGMLNCSKIRHYCDITVARSKPVARSKHVASSRGSLRPANGVTKLKMTSFDSIHNIMHDVMNDGINVLELFISEKEP